MSNKYIKKIFSDILNENFEQFSGKITFLFSDEISTACVKRNENGFLLLFNKNFIEKYDLSLFDIEFVLYHELSHLKYGDLNKIFSTNITEKEKITINIVLDIMINSLLIKNFHFTKYLTIFEKLYNLSSFPTFLLYPPSLYDFQKERENLKKVLLKNGIDEFDCELIFDLYIKMWDLKISETEAFYSLKEFLEFFEDHNPIFLGSHEKKGYSNKPINEIINFRLQKSGQKDNIKNFYEFLKFINTMLSEGQNFASKTIEQNIFYNVIDFITRKEILFNFYNVERLLYENKIYKEDFTKKDLSVYIDVSGSFLKTYPYIVKLVSQLKGFYFLELFQFSSTIKKINFNDFLKGIVTTNNMTSIDAVLKHIIDNNYKNALIISDGLIPHPSNDLIFKIKEKNIQIFSIITRKQSENKVKQFSYKYLFLKIN
ncbi:MAG: hypothetical protein ABIN35_06995 [candidate division WOR-3 bacterium]